MQHVVLVDVTQALVWQAALDSGILLLTCYIHSTYVLVLVDHIV
jgi:hypothetical protein